MKNTRTSLSPMDKAELALREKLILETAGKISTMIGEPIGTHKQYRANAHKAAQRSVEYYQSRLTILRNGGFLALTSADRAEVRKAACLLAEVSDAPGAITPERAEEIDSIAAAYRKTGHSTALLAEYAANDWMTLGALWLGGVKSSAVATAVLAIFA